MRATARTSIARATPSQPEDLTLLELVSAVGEVAEDEAEIVATVLHLLHSGRVRLCGSFRGVPIEELS